MKTWRAILVAILLAVSTQLQASDAPASLSTPVLAARYEALLDQLRCMVCQNQTLKDSHAELAQDLRDEVQRLLEQGNSDVQIRDYLVARYGDFVLYSPPMKGSTWLLWLGPFVFLAAALAVVLKLSRSRTPVAAPLDTTERARLHAALGESTDRQA